MNAKSNYPLAVYSDESGGSSRAGTNSDLWTALSAFLSLKSSNTQSTYLGVIKEWCNFLGAEPGTEKAADLFIAASDIQAVAYRNWLNSRVGQRPRAEASEKPEHSLPVASKKKKKVRQDGYQSTLSPSTIRKKLAILRRTYRAAIGYGVGVERNPFESEKIPPPSATAGQKRPTEMIDYKTVQTIIDLPDTENPKGLRDATILAVLFGAGLRRGEIIHLRLADVKRSSRGTTYLRLRLTKGKRDSDQALPNWTSSLVHELIASRRDQGAKDGDFLFISYRGKGGLHPTSHHLSDSGLYHLFKRYCNAAGVTHVVSPHSARATAITKLLDDGLTHREVQDFSRHASVQMVEVYDKKRKSIDESPAKELEF